MSSGANPRFRSAMSGDGLSSRAKALVPKRVKRAIRRGLQLPTSARYWLAARGLLMTENHRRLEALRNRHAGQRAIVMGSGPSLNRMDLRPLRHEITFGSNAIYLLEERLGFLPTYLTVEDPLPAEDNAKELNALRGTTKIFAHDLAHCLRSDPNTVYVFFDRYRVGDEDPGFPFFSMDALRRVYWGGTVAYMSLQLAYYMGIREVYLIGIDLDYKIPDHAEGDVIVSREADQSHFHPDYFGPGKRWHHPKVERMARAFERAADCFAAKGGAVWNATAGGKLESLSRVDYNKVVGAETGSA